MPRNLSNSTILFFSLFVITPLILLSIPVSAMGSSLGYYIINPLSGKCIDVKGVPGKSNGDLLQIWDCERSGINPDNNSTTDQKWEIIEGGFIRNVLSGKCIDVKGVPGKSNGDLLQIWDCERSGINPDNNSTTDQKWEIIEGGFIRNVLSGKCIDVKGVPGKSNGDLLQIWDCERSGINPDNNSTTDQKFIFNGDSTPPSASSAHAISITISTVSPSRYRLIGTLVDANNQPACGLALASGRCVFTCGPGSPRCEGGIDSLPLGQFDLTDLPTEASGALNLQSFASGSLPGLQVVQSDGTVQLVNSGGSRASSGAINTSRSEVSPGRYRLTGTLVDGNNQPACGLALASGRCVFTCGPGSPRCEGGADNLPLGQFDLTDLPAEANGALNLQTFVFGSLPGLQAVNSGGGGSGGGGCSYAITPQTKQFSAQDGSGEVAVSTQNGCSWTAQSNVNWIAIALGNSGSGPGAVKYLVSSNSGVASRTGTLTIAGQEFTVSQSPPPPDSGGGGGQ